MLDQAPSRLALGFLMRSLLNGGTLARLEQGRAEAQHP
jgi:hypothetical protein